MRLPGVLHVIDALDAGGAERTAVTLANHTPRDRFTAHLCTTRRSGPLAAALQPGVTHLALERKHRFDPSPVFQLVRYIHDQNIRILHAHGPSLFFAGAASLCHRRPALIWHAHYGRRALENRLSLPYLAALRMAGAVIAVNETIARWVCSRLRVPKRKVYYVPNPVTAVRASTQPACLPGTPGRRIVCVANFHPDKDHFTLLHAFEMIIREIPDAHLLLAGGPRSQTYFHNLVTDIAARNLGHNLSLLGERMDVPDVLAACDVGVLSSCSEGLPVSLLEYGSAGLAAVATDVGQCAEVLDFGRAGRLVPTGAPEQLAQAVLALLRNSEERSRLARTFHRHVEARYSPEKILSEICAIYDRLLNSEQSKLPSGVMSEA
jgi:glycosyltransferase involved in cell wall biosynthesis